MQLENCGDKKGPIGRKSPPPKDRTWWKHVDQPPPPPSPRPSKKLSV